MTHAWVFTTLLMPPFVAITPQLVLEKCLAARQRIVAADCEFTLVRATHGNTRPGLRDSSSVRHIWFNARSYRQDVTENSKPDLKTLVGLRHVHCWECIKPGHSLVAIDGPYRSELYHSLPDSRVHFSGVIDPRLAGYINLPQAAWAGPPGNSQKPLDNEFSTGEFPAPAVMRAEYEGHICYHLDSTSIRNGRTRRVTIVPEYGWSVVRVESVRRVKNISHAAVTTSAMKYHRDSQTWFPDRVEYRATTDSKPTLTEVFEFSAVQINMPIDPEVFTLKGVGLADGSRMAYPFQKGSPHQIFVVRDGALVDEAADEKARGVTTAAPPAPEPVAPAAVSNRSQWWYAAAAVLFAAVAVVFVRRFARRG